MYYGDHLPGSPYYRGQHCVNCGQHTRNADERGLCEDCLNDPEKMEEYELKMEDEIREINWRMTCREIFDEIENQ